MLTLFHISLQLLRSKTTGPLRTVQFVDLSNLEILSIERLSCCPKVRTLILGGNNLQSVSNIDSCNQLWYLDFSNNDIRCLVGLSRFMALGTLVLANNDLSWPELAKIRHIHILQLTLLGNPRLERDPFYRLHVIDCLPHIWMLDGKLITSTERLQVEHFFQSSALSSHPVRHKLPKDRFIPSSLKNINVTGIYGEKATHLLRRFPTDGPINIETDRRRVLYLAYNLQQDLLLQKRSVKLKSGSLKFQPAFMEILMAARPKCLEQCNMLLLLLVASLDFSLPAELMRETLETSKLDQVGDVHTMDLFLFPRDIRCNVVSILMNAVKVDKDGGKDGGLYGTLYHCLDHTVSQLNRLRYQVQHTPNSTHLSVQQRDHKCLLASEVVQLLCVVPAFFQYLDKDEGVKSLLTAAARSSSIIDEILVIAKTAKLSRARVKGICEQVAVFIMEKVEEQLENVVNKKVKLDAVEKVFNETRALPIKRPNSVALADYHMTGKRLPERETVKIHQTAVHGVEDAAIFPHLGDKVLMGPQTVGKIVALPQPFLALVQMDTVPDENGAMVTYVKQADIHYTYADMTKFQWRFAASIWKPNGTVGDRITIQKLDDRWQELEDAGFFPHENEGFGRPNSPVSGYISPPKSPRQFQRVIPKLPHKGLIVPKPARKPRPMSAVLKEKLHLNLDLSRRPKSAVVKGSVPTGDQSLDDNPDYMLDTFIGSSPNTGYSNVQLTSAKTETTGSADVTVDSVEDPTFSQVRVDTRNIHCQTESRAEMQNRIVQRHPSPDDCIENFDKIVTINTEPSPMGNSLQQNDAIESFKRNVTPEHTADSTRLVTAEGEVTDVTRDKDVVSPRLQQVAISIPRADLVDSLNTSKEDSTYILAEPEQSMDHNEQKQAAKRNTITSPRPDSRVLMNILESRPYSAVEAYKFVVKHPQTGYNDNANTTVGRGFPRRKSAPPIRHRPPVPFTSMSRKYDVFGNSQASSVSKPTKPTPQAKDGVRCGHCNVTVANSWLANGRDIYSEMQDKRPKSGYVPGWKEGLPKGMKYRPKMFAVSTQTSKEWDFNCSAHIPPHLMYYDFMQAGSPRDSLQLPELPCLSDYLGSSREAQL